MERSPATEHPFAAAHPPTTPPPLLTERLLIRPFAAGDGDALHACLGDPEVVRFEPYDPPSLEDCRREAERRATDPDFWAVCLRPGTAPPALVGTPPALIGNLWLHRTEPTAARIWELGYVMGRAWWHRGFATEASHRLLDHVFASGAHRVEARCDPRNEPSWRLLERLGMRREAHHVRAVTFRNDASGEPVWHDAYVYAVLADEWTHSAGTGSTGS